jgi:hypothetical protein
MKNVGGFHEKVLAVGGQRPDDLNEPVTSGQLIMACAWAMPIEVTGIKAASDAARTSRLEGSQLSR